MTWTLVTANFIWFHGCTASRQRQPPTRRWPFGGSLWYSGVVWVKPKSGHHESWTGTCETFSQTSQRLQTFIVPLTPNLSDVRSHTRLYPQRMPLTEAKSHPLQNHLRLHSTLAARSPAATLAPPRPRPLSSAPPLPTWDARRACGAELPGAAAAAGIAGAGPEVGRRDL